MEWGLAEVQNSRKIVLVSKVVYIWVCDDARPRIVLVREMGVLKCVEGGQAHVVIYHCSKCVKSSLFDEVWLNSKEL